MSDFSVWDVVETYQASTFEELIKNHKSFEEIIQQDKFIQEVKAETTVLID